MEQLWSKRFSVFLEERIFLLRRLANGFAFLPILILMFGLYYYPMFLDWVPNNFPVEFTIAIISTWVVARGGFRSFLLSSDVIYLSPIEARMRAFFFKSYLYNVGVQGFFVLSYMIVLSPLYFDRISSQFSHFTVFVLILLLLKVCNIFINWYELKWSKRWLFICRVLFDFLLIFGLLIKVYLLVIIALVLLIGTLFGVRRINGTNRINWLRIIDVEQQLNAVFYQWVGIFIENPHAISKINPNRVFIRLTKWIFRPSMNPFSFLYLKTFLRTEVVGMIMRIAIIGMLILSFVTHTSIQLEIYAFMLLMIGIQISTFWLSFNQQFWANLYPIPKKTKLKAFLDSSNVVLMFFAMIIPIAPLIQHYTLTKLIGFYALAIVIPLCFIYLYFAKKASH